MTAWILALLLSLPVAKQDRAPELAEAKAQQLRETAGAIAAAVEAQRGWPGSKHELAVLMVVVAYHESAFRMRIAAGECGPHECDRGRDGKVRAAGLWQLHESATSSREAWEYARVSTATAAREAARALTRARRMCRSLERDGDWVRLTVSAFAGRGCGGWFRGLEARVATYQRLSSAR